MRGMRSHGTMLLLSQCAKKVPEGHKHSTPPESVQQVQEPVYDHIVPDPVSPARECVRPYRASERSYSWLHSTVPRGEPASKCQKASAPPPQLEQVMQHGGEESSHYTHKSAITKNADDNVPGCIVSTYTNSEDIGSGQFIKIVCFLPHLTSPARPATSARPPHKFLHCFSDTQVRLPTCTARLRGPALPASDFNC